LRGNAEALEYVLFPKGSVKTGDRCIVIVQPDTEVGVHGTMAGTDNCVIPLTDTEKVAEVERLVEQLK